MIELLVGKGRARGKMFWGCSRYPDCDFASWTNPLGSQTDAEKPQAHAAKKRAASRRDKKAPHKKRPQSDLRP
ncbi:MAG: topoisomerase DNA-binding C4 zinc finger domain-containing protein [Candidatus Liptonbacteria bacterium]|nr:topoisomerase DNA-binding C4 zinc finger domain-containing protein [Candidatus Liptonbacteria bacterium]